MKKLCAITSALLLALRILARAAAVPIDEPIAGEEHQRTREQAGDRAPMPSSELDRLGEPSHRHVHHAAGRLLRVVGVELLEQRRVDRAGAQRVDAHAAACELHPELAREREHAALRRGVGDL